MSRHHWLGLPVLVLLTLFGASCSRSPAPAPKEVVERGRAVYNFRCYYCHGYSGDSKTLAATYMTPPPHNFKAATPDTLPLERILAALREGRPGTAMKPFANVIPAADLEAVAAFVFDEFVLRKAPNTRYHTPENGWPNHERYRDAGPFAQGEVALTEPPENLTPAQQRGRTLYLESCVSCHDRGQPGNDPTIWDSRPLSYPRNNYDHREPAVDATSSATPYRLHDVPPPLRHPTAGQRRGEKLFQDNCAFCHAADGTGKNWIGAFLEPHPRDLTNPQFRAAMSEPRYREVILKGVPGTSMPAWSSVLSAAQIDDLISYIEVAFRGP